MKTPCHDLKLSSLAVVPKNMRRLSDPYAVLAIVEARSVPSLAVVLFSVPELAREEACCLVPEMVCTLGNIGTLVWYQSDGEASQSAMSLYSSGAASHSPVGTKNGPYPVITTPW